jgi:septal ring factor EnvC (AmiA/AmiB activator)
MDMSYSIIEFISVILNLLLGGGLIVLFTMRAQRKKATAEAEAAEANANSSELDNVEKAITIWREMAENLRVELEKRDNEYKAMQEQLSEFKKAVDKMNTTNAKILRVLETISRDNIEGPVKQIKDAINNAHV